MIKKPPAFAGLAQLLTDAVVAQIDGGIHVVVLFTGGEVQVLSGEQYVGLGAAAFHGKRDQKFGILVADHALNLLEALEGVILQGIGRGEIAENNFDLHKQFLPRPGREREYPAFMGRKDLEHRSSALKKETSIERDEGPVSVRYERRDPSLKFSFSVSQGICFPRRA